MARHNASFAHGYEVDRREKSDKMTYPPTIRVVVGVDYGYLADFLRQLAQEVENKKEDFDRFDTSEGYATIDWNDIPGIE